MRVSVHSGFCVLVSHITSRDKCKIPGEEERWCKGIWKVACVGKRSRKDVSSFSQYSGNIFVLMTPSFLLRLVINSVFSSRTLDYVRYPRPSHLNTSKCVPKPVHSLRFAPVFSTSFLSCEFSLHCVFYPLSQLHCHCPSA